MDDPNLPEKRSKSSNPTAANGAIRSEKAYSLQTTKDTQYQIYIMVQNELTRAINEIRDEVSKNKFQMKFSDLGEAGAVS